MFAVTIDKRDRETLIKIILEHVIPGSIVINDVWKGYNLFKNNPNFQHHWVNHSISFINIDGYHTNHIEGTWNGIKYKIKAQSRTKGKMQGYFLNISGEEDIKKIYGIPFFSFKTINFFILIFLFNLHLNVFALKLF
ncbi:hypothetical protein DMUE_3390 [Dictyocoela muelleri]|nr:hypothetical protein DMUE_3390 [Dictyocoela muelleri]